MKTCETCKFLQIKPAREWVEVPCKGFWGKLGMTDYEIIASNTEVEYFCMALPEKTYVYKKDRQECSMYKEATPK